jgi:hypothetical protein
VARLLFVILLVQAAAHTLSQSAGTQPAGNSSPANTSAEKPDAVATVSGDPAAVTFSTELGLLLVAVKPTASADYEAAIVALQEALAKAEDETTRAIAKGWRVYKTDQTDAKANVLYVHVLQPTVAEADYRPSMLLDKLLGGAPAELLAKYRDSFAIPPTKLSLTEFAHMSVAPVPKPTNTSPKNASPAAPAKNSTPAKPA